MSSWTSAFQRMKVWSISPRPRPPSSKTPSCGCHARGVIDSGAVEGRATGSVRLASTQAAKSVMLAPLDLNIQSPGQRAKCHFLAGRESRVCATSLPGPFGALVATRPQAEMGQKPLSQFLYCEKC
ncbi:hypothetical protein FH972_026660 [Carpinus fangiana]|uniref:Uncharacterized protein n=1 Tax=Carpinus fangiana TaxID=176857 RepID=A0A5N6L759_9ROSI|nr:hypothetical protein FH972_026660 [Carpinus fangiana]